jgi:hypothetical protein
MQKGVLIIGSKSHNIPNSTYVVVSCRTTHYHYSSLSPNNSPLNCFTVKQMKKKKNMGWCHYEPFSTVDNSINFYLIRPTLFLFLHPNYNYRIHFIHIFVVYVQCNSDTCLFYNMLIHLYIYAYIHHIINWSCYMSSTYNLLLCIAKQYQKI